jgi:CubicO group peptidase (beta-lactamase class C family)
LLKITIGAIALIAASPVLAGPTEDRAAQALDKAISSFRPPAMSAVVIQDSIAGPEVARGVQRLGSAQPIKRNQRWLLGSATKMMTATMVSRLVEQGKLSWTSDLQTMLPDLAATMRPEYRSVTLIDLLSHSAGLPAQLLDEQWVYDRFANNNDPLPKQRTDYIDHGLKDPPIAPPKSKASYSNTGYIIAAAIAERATAKSYEELMDELVFKPLGMTSATFAPEGEDELKSYFEGRPAEPLDGNPAIFNGAGEVRMTMADWSKFVVDQLAGQKGKGRLLSPGGYRMMQSPQGPQGNKWGFGWEVRKSPSGTGSALSHEGSDGNWIVQVTVYPETGNGLLIATNSGYSMGTDKALAFAVRELTSGLASAGGVRGNSR